MTSKLWLFGIIVLFSITFPLSFAQHHSGQSAPPTSFEEGEVAVSTLLSPDDFTSAKYSDANLKIRFFDTRTDINIQSVTYRVQIFYGTQLVANQMFFDNDGELEIKIKPRSECQQKDLWKCTKYYGDVDPLVPNALSSKPSSIPVISGPVFVNAGQYTVKTDIIGAKSPKTQTTRDIPFETTIIIPSEQKFKITASGVPYFISTKNFNNLITELHFNESSQSIMFQIPFNWEHIEHIDSLKNYIEIPKNFLPFQNTDSFYGKVNDVLIFPKDLHYDKYSSQNSNILFFMINNDELKQLRNSDSKINIVITPTPQSTIVSEEILFDNGFKAHASYDSRYSKSKDFIFSIVFFDPKGNLATDVRYGYGLKNPSGKEIANIGSNNLGIVLSNGIDTRTLSAPIEGTYLMQIGLLGIGSDTFEKPLFTKFKLEIITRDLVKTDLVKTAAPKMVISKSIIPKWIKNTAGWWADDSIDDNSFVQGIQFLIKEKLLNIPSTERSGIVLNEIPKWVKDTAGWWADGKINDTKFIQAIQFLIKEGMIKP